MITRHTRRITALFLTYILFTALPAMACFDADIRDQTFKVEGKATTLDGELLYIETLTQTPDASGGKLVVDYKDNAEKPIAKKIVEYNCNPTTPSFFLEDKTSGEREGVNWKETDLESFQGDTVVQIEQPSGPAVVDAGFDNVIKLNWETLMSNKAVKYSYLFARRNKFLKLRFSKSRPPREIRALVNKAGKSATDLAFFKVGANNMIFRMLSSPIYVGYDTKTKALAYYYGPTNLPMIDSEKQILITYRSLR